MNNELREIIDGADVETLKIIERNSVDGPLKDVLRRKITRVSGRYCTTCTNKIDPFSNSFTLHFGKDDFKKQAHFCALDCLEFFMASLKSMNEASNKKN
jgi:hypothetical protein